MDTRYISSIFFLMLLLFPQVSQPYIKTNLLQQRDLVGLKVKWIIVDSFSGGPLVLAVPRGDHHRHRHHRYSLWKGRRVLFKQWSSQYAIITCGPQRNTVVGHGHFMGQMMPVTQLEIQGPGARSLGGPFYFQANILINII